MSLVKLECPICEFVFETDLSVTDRARCTCCGHLFHPGRSTIQPSKSRAPESRAPVSPTLPETNAPNVKGDSQEMVGRSDQLRSSIMLQRLRARRRSNLILLLLFIGALVAGALVAKRFGNLEEQRQQQITDLQPASTHQSSITPVPNIVVETVLPDPPPQSPQPPAKKEAPKPASTLQLDPPKFLLLTSSVAADQAASAKPYMVLLEIESPSGTTHATGTIVDSRGYVLTSLPAVKGATKIQVSSARSRAQIRNQTAPPMSDTIRSVVAVSNSQQWALLEINRRLVLNAADIRIPTTDRIVSRQPLLRVVAPRSPNDYAVSEMRVDQRRRSSQLGAAPKELLNISHDNEGPNWIVSPHSPYDQLGAALFSTDGKLMAVLVNFDRSSSYYVDTSALGKRLKENNFSKTPLSSLK